MTAPPRPISCCERFISSWTLIPPSKSAASAPAEARNQPRVFLATQRCGREQPTDQRIAIAHRPQQQLRRRRRLVRIAPEPVRSQRVDEKRDAEASRMLPARSAARSIDMVGSLRATRPIGRGFDGRSLAGHAPRFVSRPATTPWLTRRPRRQRLRARRVLVASESAESAQCEGASTRTR